MLKALSSGSVLTNAMPLVAGGTSSNSGGAGLPRQLTHGNATRARAPRTKRERTIMSQDSASKVLSLAVALVLLAAGCRPKPAIQEDLFSAHYLGVTYLERGQLPEAEAHFKTVVALTPDDPLGYANLGLTYLRGGRYADAEVQLRRARRLDPANPEVGLIAGKLYGVPAGGAEAREILEGLPRDAKVLYALAQLGPQDADKLRGVLALAPANLAVRLQLVDALVRRGAADSAIRHLEEIRRLHPEPPPEARPQLDAALRDLRAGRLAPARVALDRFLRLMEVTTPYQAALSKIAWTEGPLAGRPVLAFNPQSLIATRGGGLMQTGRTAEVRFTDVTAEAGFPEHGTAAGALALGDYDGDGEDNLFVAPASLYHVHGGFLGGVAAPTRPARPRGAPCSAFAGIDK